VLGAAKLAGADLALAALALANFGYVEGRGQRLSLAIRDKTFTLIDETYNANPSSMRAALAVTGSIPRGSRGRRIAVLGDMLELGAQAPQLHAGLESAIIEHDIDLVFASGEMMRHLFQALPATRRGAYAESADALAPLLAEAVAPGDVVVVKGSNGSRMSKVVAALKARYPLVQAEAQG
jgi:UDP-N-acetylmuramyl pentapeptide synthase